MDISSRLSAFINGMNPSKTADSSSPISHARFQGSEVFSAVHTGAAKMSVGASGADVQALQQALSDMGFHVGEIDGKFGRQTATALKNFQSNQKLTQTGELDAATFQKLEKAAPPPGKKLWDKDVPKAIKDANMIPSNLLKDGKAAKAVVDLSEHRLFVFDEEGDVKKIYSVASGNPNNPSGRGEKTRTGTMVVTGKNNDPRDVADRLWPETKGKAFGTRLVDLSMYDEKTGKSSRSPHELHGTYANDSIGKDASNGCMRMLNEDIEEVFNELKNGDKFKVQD